MHFAAFFLYKTYKFEMLFTDLDGIMTECWAVSEECPEGCSWDQHTEQSYIQECFQEVRDGFNHGQQKEDIKAI